MENQNDMKTPKSDAGTAATRLLLTVIVCGVLYAVHTIAMIRFQLYPGTRLVYLLTTLAVFAACLVPAIGLLRKRQIGVGLALMLAGIFGAYVAITIGTVIGALLFGGRFGTWP